MNNNEERDYNILVATEFFVSLSTLHINIYNFRQQTNKCASLDKSESPYSFILYFC